MDLTDSIIPKSDQINADDLITGPRTCTIDRVSKGSAEQPVDVHLVEFPGRAYRPSKSMRRVMVAGWGKMTDIYPGRRLTLYRDPDVKFGGDKVGGIKISHLSDIDARLTVALTATRGKREQFTVEPLPAASAPVPVTAEQIAACTDLDQLREWWKYPALRPQLDARMKALIAAAADEPATAASDDDDRSAEAAELFGSAE